MTEAALQTIAMLQTIAISWGVGAIAFIVATIIDHELGISCPTVAKIGVPGWKLLLHKFMYVGVGALFMYALFSNT